MKRALISFGAGILAAASLPQAGWTNFIYDLTPWSFPLYALAVYWLYRQISEPYLIIHAYLWASGYFLFGLSWVGNALLVGGNPYAWAWPLAVIGLPLLLSFFLAILVYSINSLVSTGLGINRVAPRASRSVISLNLIIPETMIIGSSEKIAEFRTARTSSRPSSSGITRSVIKSSIEGLS